MDKIENKLDEFINGEENDIKRKRFKKRVKWFRN